VAQQLTKEYIQSLLMRQDEVGMHAVGRALVVLLSNQTADEASAHYTKYHNRTGFTPNDARHGTTCAEFYTRNGYLTEDHMAYWNLPAYTARGKVRILKYWAQLLEEAIHKQNARQAALAA
jgi:hypothetical protein